MSFGELLRRYDVCLFNGYAGTVDVDFGGNGDAIEIKGSGPDGHGNSEGKRLGVGHVLSVHDCRQPDSGVTACAR